MKSLIESEFCLHAQLQNLGERLIESLTSRNNNNNNNKTYKCTDQASWFMVYCTREIAEDDVPLVLQILL